MNQYSKENRDDPPGNVGLRELAKRALLATMAMVGMVWVLSAITNESYAQMVVDPRDYADSY